MSSGPYRLVSYDRRLETGDCQVSVSVVAKPGGGNGSYCIPNELICGTLARFIRLPVPPFGILGGPTPQDSVWFGSFDFNLTGEKLPRVDTQVCAIELSDLFTGIMLHDMLVLNLNRIPSDLNVNFSENSTSKKYEAKEVHSVRVFDYNRALFGSQPNLGGARLMDNCAKLGCASDILKSLPTAKYFAEWLKRIKAIPDWLIRAVTQEARRYGLAEHEVSLALKVLQYRRDNLRSIVQQNRSRFGGIKDWDLHLPSLGQQNEVYRSAAVPEERTVQPQLDNNQLGEPSSFHGPYPIGVREGKVGNDSWYVNVSATARPSNADKPYRIFNDLIGFEFCDFLGLPVPPSGIVRTADVREPYSIASWDLLPKNQTLPLTEPQRCCRDLPRLSTGVILFDVYFLNANRQVNQLFVDFESAPPRMMLVNSWDGLFGIGKREATLTRRSQSRDIFALDQHCLLNELRTAQYFPEWIDRIRAIPDFVINDIIQQARAYGLKAAEASAAESILKHRRNHFPNIIQENQSRFRGIEEWNIQWPKSRMRARRL